MSYCEIVTFKDGKPNGSVEYRNAWGGSVFIWTALFDKYLKDPSRPYHSWFLGEPQALWDLATRKDLPLCERAVHTSTFDRAMVRREHFEMFVLHLREFVSRYPRGDGVCHLSAWANFIESCDAEAVGFVGTSVSGSLWSEWNEETDEERLYDLNSGYEHLEVYDWLEAAEAVKGIPPRTGGASGV